MPINFRRTKTLNKLVKVTVSKNGPSISIGRPGARVSVNKEGVRGSVGIPGSGVSYTKQKSFPKKSPIKKIAGIAAGILMAVIILYLLLEWV